MKKRYKIIIVIILLITLAIAGGNLFYNSLARNLDGLRELPIQNVDLSKLNDGTYNGGYKQFPVAAEVKVIIKNHRITEINLIKHNNGQGASAERVIDKVIEAQSLGVDIVSGATYSSMVILKAIEDALRLDAK